MPEITLDVVNETLLLSNSIPSGRNFVGVAVMPDEEGKAIHSGILIKYNDKSLLFDYDGELIRLMHLPHPRLNVFYKELSFITSEEVPAFLAHCTQIQKNANPKFGYFYGGDYYDQDGKYFSVSDISEYMTCVGFCINVVQGYLESHSYFVHLDWDESSYNDPTYDGADDYFHDFLESVKKHNPDKTINEKLFRQNLRRITPAEFTSSAYIENLPIRKSAIEPILTLVNLALQQKVSDISNSHRKSA